MTTEEKLKRASEYLSRGVLGTFDPSQIAARKLIAEAIADLENQRAKLYPRDWFETYKGPSVKSED